MKIITASNHVFPLKFNLLNSKIRSKSAGQEVQVMIGHKGCPTKYDSWWMFRMSSSIICKVVWYQRQKHKYIYIGVML